MSRFRNPQRKPVRSGTGQEQPTVMLVEDSAAMALMLKSRIEAETGARVDWLKTYADAEQALEHAQPALALTGMNLPDAPDGEIIDLLQEADVPTILFTAMLNRKVRERAGAPNVIDYFMKDAADTVDQIIRTIQRVTKGDIAPILIVDDSPSARETLVQILNRQSYQIFEADGGSEALEILEDNPDISLVITDFHMADMDGQQLTRAIRKLYPPEQMRVIGISASSDPYLSAALLKAGASDFIYRPFVAEEVKYRVSGNIETLNQIKRLQFLAERDFLTGLYNRRAFFERAMPQVAAMRAAGLPASIAILDIDHFKKVNDTYGHDTGDAVIRAIAKVAQNSLPRTDCMAARLGGEEFVLLLGNLANDEAVAVCEQVREAIAAVAVMHGKTPLKVTASVGVAVLQMGESLDNNLNAADQMLYMAKDQGRNRVCADAAFY